MGDPRPFLALARGFAVAGALGSGFAVAVALGVLGGLALDRAIGWELPVAAVGLGLLGGAGGFVAVLRTLRAMEQRRAGKRPGGGPRGNSPTGVSDRR